MATVQEKELEMLFPETEVTLLGREFTIKPFSFYETMVVSKKLKSVLHLFSSELSAESLAEIYEKAFVGLVDVIALVYSLDRKTVEKMDMKNAIIAINGIIGVNKSFFAESVETEIQNLTTSLGMQQDQSTK